MFKLCINMKILIIIWIVVATFMSELVHGVYMSTYECENLTAFEECPSEIDLTAEGSEVDSAFIILEDLNKPPERNPYKEALLAHPWESVQDYVTVRPGAHIFYWLYYADGTRVGAESKPLIIWLQGGPGSAASGIANFLEIGPLNLDMKPRSHTWVKGRNVLLFDHPVGTGFSYVTNNSLLVKTDQEMANDLVKAIKEFLGKHKEFSETPTYLIGQNYGGKINPILAYNLHKAIENKSLKMNLKGIGIGNGFVVPMEYIETYASFLLNRGMIDQNAYKSIINTTGAIEHFYNIQDYEGASALLSTLLLYVHGEAGMWVNLHNINQPSAYYWTSMIALERKMNDFVKPMLSHVVNQNLHWAYTSKTVIYSLRESILMPTTSYLQMLLNETEIKVAVYNGNLDAITPLVGATNWVYELKWHGSKKFKRAKRRLILGTNNGFYKVVKQLSLWYVFGAGQWVPEDNPVAMEQILKHLISDNF